MVLVLKMSSKNQIWLVKILEVSKAKRLTKETCHTFLSQFGKLVNTTHIYIKSHLELK